MKTEPDSTDDYSLALAALGWTLSEQVRAERLLALTGLSPDDLRARLSDATLLGATLGFLEAHEPDLIACASAIGTSPEALVAARRRLEG